MNRVLILDRDGVINQDSDAYVKSADEWIPLPGSIDAMARLYKAGWTLAVATNQSGLARGYFGLKELNEQHQKLRSLLQAAGGDLQLIVWCPHGPDDQCDCRKPKPGLLHRIAEQLSIDLTQAWLVGDAARDLEAGRSVGCKLALVRTGKGEKTLRKNQGLEDVRIFDDLAAFADYLLTEG